MAQRWQQAIFCILSVALVATPTAAQKEGAVRETIQGTIKRGTSSVLKKVGSKAFSCIGKSVYQVVARQTLQCTSTRKLPFCQAPGPNRRFCPDVCSSTQWVTTSTKEVFLRDIVTNCNPIEDPFGNPTPKAQ